jgi:ATP-binding cassette subfamily C protein CydC
VAAVQAFNYLLPSAAIRLLAIARTASRYGERLTGHSAALRSLAHLRVALFERMLSPPVPDPARSSGAAAARLMQDVATLEDQLIRAPTRTGAWAGLAAALLCVALAGWAALLAAFALSLIALIAARRLAQRRLPQAATAVQSRIADLKALLVGHASAAADIAAYGLAGRLGAQLLAEAAALDAARLRLARAEAMLQTLPVIAGGLAVAAILHLSTASLPFTMLCALAATGAAELLATLTRSMGRDAIMQASMARLEEIAVLPPTPAPTTAPDAAPPALSFMLDGAPVALAPGSRVAIIGPSGSGKTRLVEALAGWREADPALRIMAGAAATPQERRPLFALAPQDCQLIAGTVQDNLRMARKGLADDALWHALDLACLAEDVRALPHGLESWVGDGGTRLSGGQRKRLALARALLAGRPWLILDEPSEGLDPATEARLRAKLSRWLDETGTGLILVTHREALLPLTNRTISLTAS